MSTVAALDTVTFPQVAQVPVSQMPDYGDISIERSGKERALWDRDQDAEVKACNRHDPGTYVWYITM